MEGCTASIIFSNSARVMVVTQAGSSFVPAGLLHNPLMVTTAAVGRDIGCRILDGGAGAAVTGCCRGRVSTWRPGPRPSLPAVDRLSNI